MGGVLIAEKDAVSGQKFLGKSPMPPKPWAMAVDRQCQMIPIEQKLK